MLPPQTRVTKARYAAFTNAHHRIWLQQPAKYRQGQCLSKTNIFFDMDTLFYLFSSRTVVSDVTVSNSETQYIQAYNS